MQQKSAPQPPSPQRQNDEARHATVHCRLRGSGWFSAIERVGRAIAKAGSSPPDFETDELERNLTSAFGETIRCAMFDDNVAAFYPAKLTKALRKHRDPWAVDQFHVGTRYLMDCSLAPCSACAANGQTAVALPRSTMNSRRLIGTPARG
jgi:hypothetical protein